MRPGNKTPRPEPDRDVQFDFRPTAGPGRYLFLPDTFALDGEGARLVTVYRGTGTTSNCLMFRDAAGVERTAAGPVRAEPGFWLPLWKLQ